jgi:GNAT superfamily N-acetyltransferase
MNQENSVAISQVTSQNIDDFLNLIDQLAQYEHLPAPNPEAKTRLRQDCLSVNPKFHAYLAKLDGKPAGYIVYFFTYSSFLASPTLFLEDIFVLEEYRRQGVGKAFFEFIKEVAKQECCGRIEFNVLKWNTSAQEFYEQTGAKRLEWFLYRIEKEQF